MFHFSRRTLWIIVYLAIPLIYVLNQLGGESETATDATEVQLWSLDALSFDHQDNRWLVDLPESDQLWLTVVQTPAPAEPLDDTRGVRVSLQGGRTLVSVVNPARLELLETSVDFLVDWLPQSDDRQLILSGPLNDEWVAALEPLNGRLQGQASVAEFQPAAAVARLIAPPMGSDEQLAFLLWIDVLERRLSGYQPEVRWDHRGERSQVLFSQTLAPNLFDDAVTDEELAPILAAYQAAAEQRQRRADQIHRYLVTTAVYDLPLDFMLQQPERLARIDVAAVNQQRQRTQGNR